MGSREKEHGWPRAKEKEEEEAAVAAPAFQRAPAGDCMTCDTWLWAFPWASLLFKKKQKKNLPQR